MRRVFLLAITLVVAFCLFGGIKAGVRSLFTHMAGQEAVAETAGLHSIGNTGVTLVLEHPWRPLKADQLDMEKLALAEKTLPGIKLDLAANLRFGASSAAVLFVFTAPLPLGQPEPAIGTMSGDDAKAFCERLQTSGVTGGLAGEQAQCMRVRVGDMPMFLVIAERVTPKGSYKYMMFVAVAGGRELDFVFAVPEGLDEQRIRDVMGSVRAEGVR